jgi:hypothetical protein
MSAEGKMGIFSGRGSREEKKIDSDPNFDPNFVQLGHRIAIRR